MKTLRYKMVRQLSLFLLMIGLVKPLVAGTKVYINFRNSSVANAAAPWNNIQSYSAGYTLSNLMNEQQQTSTIGLQMVDAWTQTNASGMTTGIYPTEVMTTCFYLQDDAQHRMRVFGLDPSKTYSFTFFASRSGAATDNRNTQYTINGTTVTLNAAANTSNTVQITGVSPNTSGEVSIVANRQTGALYGYLNAMVIEEIGGSKPQPPTGLVSTATSSAQVNLSWTDISNNETGFNIERKSGTSNYTQIASVGANVTSFKDAGLSPSTTYFYKVSAYNDLGSNASVELQVITPQASTGTKVYINFRNSSVANAAAPWNNMQSYSAGYTLSNLMNSQQQVCTIGLQMVDAWTQTNASGMTTGIYPIEVMTTCFYLQDDVQHRMRVFGLDPSKTYSFTFFASRSGAATDNRNTQYTINGTTVTLNAAANTNKTVQITGVSPNTSGEVSIAVNRQTGALFGYLNAMEIEEVANNPYTLQLSQPQYNGNISAVQWKVNSPSTDAQAKDMKEYDYYYDALNRITTSQYQNKTQGTYNGSYDEGNFSYDANGNLMSLKRYGYTPTGTKELVDDLTYSYLNSNSNQLQTIVDAGDKNFGYIDKNNTTAYTYDANGNMISDLNKGITITYNLLNLPSKVANGADYIDYIYDASGTKLQKKVYKAGVLQTTIDYNGELEFYNSALKYIHTEEGLAEYNGSSFTYDYFLKDHLGNTRAVVSANGTGDPVIGQATDYYPFGMAFTGTTTLSQPGSDNKYQYNGKEFQDETLGGISLGLLDYGWRQYDPQIGRFTTQDRFSEKYYSLTNYQYAANNPVLYIDMNGDSVVDNNNIVAGYETYLSNRLAALNGILGNKNFDYSKYGTSKGAVQAIVKELTGAQGEIAQLKASDEIYNVSFDNTLAGDQGYISYNSSTNQIDMKFSVGVSIETQGHELKHGYQFETSELSIAYDNKSRGSLYDITDETQAYYRGRAVAAGLNVNANVNDAWTRTLLPDYQTLPNGPINMGSIQGPMMMMRNMIRATSGQAPAEVYKGWRSQYKSHYVAPPQIIIPK